MDEELSQLVSSWIKKIEKLKEPSVQFSFRIRVIYWRLRLKHIYHTWRIFNSSGDVRLHAQLNLLITKVQLIACEFCYLTSDEELVFHKHEIDKLNRNFSSWSSPKTILNKAFTYREQLSLTDKLFHVLDLKNNVINYTASRSKHGQLNPDLTNALIALSDVAETEIDNAIKKVKNGSDPRDWALNNSDEGESIVNEITAHQKKLEDLRHELKLTCVRVNDQSTSFLRFVADKSGVEAVSLAILFLAISGAVYSIPYYNILDFNMLKYWVVEDYFDAGIIPSAPIFSVIFVTGFVLRKYVKKVLKSIINEKEPQLSVMTKNVGRYPDKVLFLVLMISLLVTALHGRVRGYEANSSDLFPEHAITNQGHRICHLRLIGTSSRVALFLTPIKNNHSQKCHETEFKLTNTKILALDRAQVLCHSKDDNCFKNIQDLKKPAITTPEAFTLEISHTQPQ